MTQNFEFDIAGHELNLEDSDLYHIWYAASIYKTHAGAGFEIIGYEIKPQISDEDTKDYLLRAIEAHAEKHVDYEDV